MGVAVAVAEEEAVAWEEVAVAWEEVAVMVVVAWEEAVMAVAWVVAVMVAVMVVAWEEAGGVDGEAPVAAGAVDTVVAGGPISGAEVATVGGPAGAGIGGPVPITIRRSW